MEDMEILAAGEAAENVETTTEETPKVYTEAEVNARVDALLGRKLARREAKLRREYERKYAQLSAEQESRQEAQASADTAPAPQYSARDVRLLARAEAEDIIRAGAQQVDSELERLAQLGVAGMSDREKAVFQALAEHRQDRDRFGELERLGVSEAVSASSDFRAFAAKFRPDTPAADIYQIYLSTQTRP